MPINDVKENSIDTSQIKIPLAQVNFTKEEVDAVSKVIKSGWLIFGKNVEVFEERFAKLIGAKHAIAVNSGSSALLVALQSLGVDRGDEVIVPDMSFISTGTACLYLGAKPIFVDINLKNYCIDVKGIEEKITNKTKVILPVHYWGHTADMDHIIELAKKYNLKILEDSAEAHLSTYRGKHFAGTLGDIAIFSFTPSKPMTTGEGGMITTNDDALADLCRKIINFGDYGKFDNRILGFNFRMQDINGALGRVQLKKLPQAISERRKIGKYFTKVLKDVPGVICPIPRTDSDSNYQIFPIRLDLDTVKCSKEHFIQKMMIKGIHCRTYYPAFHNQTVFKMSKTSGDFPNVDLFEKSSFVLPLYPGLSQSDQEYIVDSVSEIAHQNLS
jgi:dTDP-4-amino-4,6-dideoxygalactose transaminase|tara:strand:+ start:2768 stop:3925 length:1158 start_codon:yes stop_codon:yes gene_type:complete